MLTCLCRFSTALVFALPLAPSAMAQQAKPVAADVRIVDCDEPLQSRKRGLCANALSAEDFRAISPGVSWWYNWSTTPGEFIAPADADVEFVPMVWGDHPDAAKQLFDYLRAGHRPRVVLGINEPNLGGQAFITPQQAAQLHARIKAVTDRFDIELVAPQMAIGSPPDASIVAVDPISGQETTYTFMIPYLDAFFHFAGRGDAQRAEVAAIGIHPYDDLHALRALVELAHQETGLPIWVTEYAKQTSDEAEQREYLIKATDFLERTPYVHGYAWFKERVPPEVREAEALFEDEPGKLSSLGEAYVALPVHDENVYYRLPGKLQAESYVRLSGGDIASTADADGFADMVCESDKAEFVYQVSVEETGTFDIQLRTSGSAEPVELLKDGKVLATFKPDSGGNQYVVTAATISLEKGLQTLTLRMTAQGQRVNWIEFSGPTGNR